MEFQSCSRADMEQEVRKDKRSQDIKINDLRLPDFKNILRFHQGFCSAVRVTGQKSKHFKSPENPRSIIQEITKLYTHLQKILKKQNKDS